MKNNFLLLHEYNENTPICINAETIGYVAPHSNATIILSNNCKQLSDGILVNESTTQIYNRCKDLFILVHDAETNCRILVNKEIITKINKENEGTHICTDIFTNIYVNESVEKIYDSLALQCN